MCYDLNGLFTWGLRGMSLADKKEELIRFDFKATKFDKRTNILRGIGDVIIPGVKTFPNVYIDSKVTQKKSINGHREVKLELASKNPFIKKMVGTFIYIPKAKNRYAYFTLETHIQFEWFFDIFITKYKYKKFLEWRLKQLVRNIKDETDKETNQLIHKSINE